MITRRDFLRLGGVFSAAVLVSGGSVLAIKAKSVEAEWHGKLYRGTSDGKILVSEDGGETWILHTQFSPHLSIPHLYTDFRQRLVAVLECQGHDFKLALSREARIWRTI